MFDEIIVPKSYLKGLLTKEQEKLIKDNNYQTKCLENSLAQYKVYKQKLFIKDGSPWGSEPLDQYVFTTKKQETKNTPKAQNQQKARWEKVSYNDTVNFYTSFLDKDKNMWWVEFNFSFVDGVLDRKELVKFEIQETAEEAKEREKAREKRDAEIDAFQKTFRYKFFEKLRVALSRILGWVQKKTMLPSPNSVKIDRQRIAKKRKKLSLWKDY